MPAVETYDHIDHQAIVVSTDPVKDTVKVRIDDSNECGDCPAAKLCQATGESSGIVSITTPHASAYKKGDILTVRGTEQMHRKAIMYATVFPCIILVATMVLVYLLTLDQLTAAISGLAVTVIFFVALWAARNKIAHEFSFTIIGSPERPGHEK